jgi:hypothetical protein
VNRYMPREEWSCTQYLFDHAKLGGVTTGRFRVNVAYRAKDFDKPVLRKYEGVPAALGHITYPTVGSGKRCVRLTLEIPMLENTGYGLLSWKARFDHVSVATVYSKTHWTKRILTATELLSALDAPALVSKKASDNQEWSRELSVPCKVRAEVLNLVCQVLNPTKKRTNERDGGLPETLSGNDSGSPPRKKARVSFQMDTGVGLPTDAWARKNPQKNLEGDLMPSENEVFESEVEATEKEMEMSEKEKDRWREKACKSDDAAVPVFLWNDRVKAGLDYFTSKT